MTRKEALTELLEKVEADNGHIVLPDFRDAFDTLPSLFQSKHNASRGWDAYQGSLDAAKALHEALLPGWRWVIAADLSVALTGPQDQIISVRRGKFVNPARAWLIAILKALLAQEE